MYVEQHPDQQINPDVANLLSYINTLENEGDLNPDRTQQLGHLIIKACESVVVEAIEEYAFGVGRMLLEELNGRPK